MIRGHLKIQANFALCTVKQTPYATLPFLTAEGEVGDVVSPGRGLEHIHPTGENLILTKS